MDLNKFFCLTAILLLLPSLVFSQSVTIQEKSISLEKVFSIIQSQTNFSIIYDNRLIKGYQKIDLNLKNVDYHEALDSCIANKPLTYIISGSLIIIKEKQKQLEKKSALTSYIFGKIIGEDGNVLDGASLKIIGAQMGTTTNNLGEFEIQKIPLGAYSMLITYIGYLPKKIPISVTTPPVFQNIQLSKIDSVLNSVTVSALGINRKSFSLTYSTQNITGNELTQTGQINFLNSLSGKVAGMQINRTNGGVGGGVRVVLRGDKSTFSSQPLFVLDGIPIYNITGGPNAGLYNDGPDRGDIISQINPNDIEGIQILKGASASTLYGSQGSNGVVLIQLKKQNKAYQSINFRHFSSFEDAMHLPKLQYIYPQTVPSTSTKPGSESSWGNEKMAVANNHIKSFFKTGATITNNINISTSSEKSATYCSYSNTYNTGIIPNTFFKQNNLSFRKTGSYLNDKLTVNNTFLGSLQHIQNRLTPGIYFNPLSGLYLVPRGNDFKQFENYEYFSRSRYIHLQNWWNINHDKNEDFGGWVGQDNQQNPYWVLHRNSSSNHSRFLYNSIKLQYNFSDKSFLQARGCIDNFKSEYERKIFAGSQSTLAGENGEYRIANESRTTLYGDLIFSQQKNIYRNVSVNFIAGASVLNSYGKYRQIRGEPSAANTFLESALLQNSLDITQSGTRKQVQSLFTNFTISIAQKINFELSDRNDWSSTFAYTPAEKTGFNYFSVGSSVLINKFIKLPNFIELLVAKISYAEVGNDIEEFRTRPYYRFLQGQPVQSESRPLQMPGYYLKPERSKSFEVNIQAALFYEKLKVNIACYHTNTINLLFPNIIVVPGLGGGTIADINAGNIRNRGCEIIVNYYHATDKLIQWNATLNFSTNNNKIIKLFDESIVNAAPEHQYYYLKSVIDNFIGVIHPNGSYGDIYGKKFKRDGEGNLILDNDTHLPLIRDNQYVANPNPRFILGWQNDITYKKLTVGILVDGKFGGKVLSKTNAFLDQFGVSEATAINNRMVEIKGITESGNKWQGELESRVYYQRIGGKTPVEEAYLFSATSVRLRELYITRNFTNAKQGIKNFDISIYGNNLFFFYINAPFDPELVSGATPGGVGVDTFGLPIFRSIGLKFSMNL